MALTVVVRSGEGEGEETPLRITFDAPRIVIGRGEGCEVRLPDPSVSHRHASIRQRGTDYIVLDEGSTNGTFVGPVRLSPQAPRVLRSGDLVRVGRVWLEILVEQALPTQNLPMATRELALQLVGAALERAGEPAGVRVRVTAGPGEGAEVVLTEFDRPYVVGRMASADLNVDDPDLSRRHVELIRRAERLLVRDLGSKNGSALGERRLRPEEETPWPRLEPLRIGGSTLVYEDPIADALSELERAADERVAESDVIAPPSGVKVPSERPASPPPPSGAPPPASVRPRRPVAPGSARWTGLDVMVVLVALAVLGLSIGALVWLMRGG
jgi:pSer/pThr/pTyr-binding forkhead associated (FHA) protein